MKTGTIYLSNRCNSIRPTWEVIKVDGEVLFESGFEFRSQCIDKLFHPPIAFVVLMAVADEDVVFKAVIIEGITKYT